METMLAETMFADVRARTAQVGWCKRTGCVGATLHLHQHTRAARARTSANMVSANMVSVALIAPGRDRDVDQQLHPHDTEDRLAYPRSGGVHLGWYYLSIATCLTRPRLFYVLFAVSRTTIISYMICHF